MQDQAHLITLPAEPWLDPPPNGPRLTDQAFASYIKGESPLPEWLSPADFVDGWLVPGTHWSKQIDRIRQAESLVRPRCTRRGLAGRTPAPPPPPEPTEAEVEAAADEERRNQAADKLAKFLLQSARPNPSIGRPRRAPGWTEDAPEADSLPTEPAPPEAPEAPVDAVEPILEEPAVEPILPFREIEAFIDAATIKQSTGTVCPEIDRALGIRLADFDDELALSELFGEGVSTERDVTADKIDLDALRGVAGLLDPRRFTKAVWILSPSVWLDHCLRAKGAAEWIDVVEMRLFGRDVLLSVAAPRPTRGAIVAALADLSAIELREMPITDRGAANHAMIGLRAEPTEEGVRVRMRVATEARLRDGAGVARLRLVK